jgi:hypothetical protein
MNPENERGLTDSREGGGGESAPYFIHNSYPQLLIILWISIYNRRRVIHRGIDALTS